MSLFDQVNSSRPPLFATAHLLGGNLTRSVSATPLGQLDIGRSAIPAQFVDAGSITVR